MTIARTDKGVTGSRHLNVCYSVYINVAQFVAVSENTKWNQKLYLLLGTCL